MDSGKTRDHVTARSEVAVTQYLREVLDHRTDSNITVVETRLEEHFTSDLHGRRDGVHKDA